MTHGSLFSGIGGFDLAASWIGWKNIFQCEINPFCQKVLKYHFPECELFSDIKTIDFKKYASTIDVISGGFPCQPLSERTVRHEEIHALQAKDCGGWIRFYLRYLIYWIRFGYRNNPFEIEAYNNDFKPDYLEKRQKLAWKKELKIAFR